MGDHLLKRIDPDGTLRAEYSQENTGDSFEEALVVLERRGLLRFPGEGTVAEACLYCGDDPKCLGIACNVCYMVAKAGAAEPTLAEIRGKVEAFKQDMEAGRCGNMSKTWRNATYEACDTVLALLEPRKPELAKPRPLYVIKNDELGSEWVRLASPAEIKAAAEASA